MVRIKHRYLLVNFLYPDAKPAQQVPSLRQQDDTPWVVQFRRPSSDRLDARLLIRMIRDNVADLFGDYGSGMISGSLQVKYISTATSVAIIRVARAHYRLVWAALTFTTRIPKPVDQTCVIQVVRVSGTIKKSEEEAIRRARSIILHARRTRPNASLLGGLPSLPGIEESEDLNMDIDMELDDPVDPSDGDESEGD